MVITCPNCKKQHEVDEKRIPSSVKVVRCRSCRQRFPLRIPEREAPAGKKKEPRKIAVALSKGGVGKTTTAVNLSAGLALAGKKVLLVDTDTQGQDSYMLGCKPKAGLTELVTEELAPDEAIVAARDGLWLLAGGKSLAGLKRLIHRKDFGGELTLSEALTPLDDKYDFVIIDTAPGWDPLTVNALFYVKEILTPVSLEVMTLHGLVEFLKSVSSIQKYRKELQLKYIVPTFMDQRVRHPTGILAKLEKLYKKQLCTPIRYNVRLSEAPAYGQTVYEFAPGSHGAEDYRDLVRKVANDDTLFR